MNYLGHAYLSYNNPQVLLGNIAGDHFKGKLSLAALPEDMQKGVMLHRSIDGFTDTHPATARAKVWFREAYGLYSSAIIDVVYDHFLANDPKIFASEKDLYHFTQDTYRTITDNEHLLPETFAAYFPHMKEHNWLYGYRTMIGIERSLKGLARRAKHMPPPDEAYNLFVTNYYALNQCYYELIDDLITFVKIELSK